MTLEAAWEQHHAGEGRPVLCGNPDCREWYAPPVGEVGAADAEGLFFSIGGQSIRGEDLNICPECALLALSGKKPFRRKGLVVTLRAKADRL